MPYQTHSNLSQIPTGSVDWVAEINYNSSILEQGTPTLKLTAFDALGHGLVSYVATDGQAHLANATSLAHGLWQSATNATGTDGFLQINGILTNSSWNLNKGKYFYPAASGAISSVFNPSARPIALSISSVLVQVNPPFTRTNLICTTKYTTDEIATAIITKTLTTGKAYLIKADVIAKQQNSTNVAGYIISAVAQRTSASTVLLMNSTVEYTFESSATWDASLGSTTNDIVLLITGATAGSTIDWKAQLEFIET